MVLFRADTDTEGCSWPPLDAGAWEDVESGARWRFARPGNRIFREGVADTSPAFEVERGACAEAIELGKEGEAGMPRGWGSFFRVFTDFWAAEILDRVSARGVSGSSESTLVTSSFTEAPL